MKKLLKGGLLLLVALIMTCNVNAESYYTNANGVEMTEAEYSKLKSMVSDDYIYYMSQEEFDKLKNAELVSSDVTYQKVITMSDGQEITQDITKDEYDNANNSYSTQSTMDATMGTNYKTLHASLYKVDDYYHLISTLDWKKKPATTSYDVFAFWSNNFSYSNFIATQNYYAPGQKGTVNYSTKSKGYRGLSNGAGISMNLTDGSNITGYTAFFSVDLRVKDSSRPTYAYISYQHAKYKLTRAQSKSYTLNIGGLGNVVYYTDEAIRGTYDNMRGVRVNL